MYIRTCMHLCVYAYVHAYACLCRYKYSKHALYLDVSVVTSYSLSVVNETECFAFFYQLEESLRE